MEEVAVAMKPEAAPAVGMGLIITSAFLITAIHWPDIIAGLPMYVALALGIVFAFAIVLSIVFILLIVRLSNLPTASTQQP